MKIIEELLLDVHITNIWIVNKSIYPLSTLYFDVKYYIELFIDLESLREKIVLVHIFVSPLIYFFLIYTKEH